MGPNDGDETVGGSHGARPLEIDQENNAPEEEGEAAKPLDSDEALKSDEISTGEAELTQDASDNRESGEASSTPVSKLSIEAPVNQTGLIAAQTREVDEPGGEEMNASKNDSGNSGDRIAYVAFDDGIPDEDEMPDMSMQSLDVGVESLSMDDSLHLGALHAGNNEPEQLEPEQLESESLRDTVEGAMVDSLKSARLRVFTDEAPDGFLLDIPETGMTLGLSLIHI